jgi:hypothetical protein
MKLKGWVKGAVYQMNFVEMEFAKKIMGNQLQHVNQIVVEGFNPDCNSF